MRIPFVVYGLLYILVELVGTRLEEIGWPQLTALDVATAVVHAVVTVSVGVAALLALDVLARRWRRLRRERPEPPMRDDDGPGTLTVHAWRPEPPALPAAPAPPPFTGPDYAAPAEDGALPLYVPSEILDRHGRRL